MICKKTILVVEDDKEMNSLECELLNLGGFDTQPAYTGVEAVEKCCQLQPDAVLMDVMLPEMDGFEACRCITDSQHRAPVVMLTTLDGHDSSETATRSGAAAYLTKPFDAKTVINTLKSLV